MMPTANGVIVAGTGHRPQKCAIGRLAAFSDSQALVMYKLAKYYLKQRTVSLVISGGALGWDMAIARAAYSLDIPYHVYVPFKGQELTWNAKQRENYHYLLEWAEDVKLLSDKPYSSKLMQERNEAMVNDCDLLLALWDGQESGGTWNCIRYAQSRGCDIVNTWKEYEDLSR